MEFSSDEFISVELMNTCDHVQVAWTAQDQFGSVGIVEGQSYSISVVKDEFEPCALRFSFSGSLCGLVQSVNDHTRYPCIHVMRRYQRINDITFFDLIIDFGAGKYSVSRLKGVLVVDFAGQTDNGYACFPKVFEDDLKRSSQDFLAFDKSCITRVKGLNQQIWAAQDHNREGCKLNHL